MAKIYNKIVESTTEPSKEDLWLKEGKIKKFKNGWEDISGKSDVKIPTKVSELENDSNYAKDIIKGELQSSIILPVSGGSEVLLFEISEGLEYAFLDSGTSTFFQIIIKDSADNEIVRIPSLEEVQRESEDGMTVELITYTEGELDISILGVYGSYTWDNKIDIGSKIYAYRTEWCNKGNLNFNIQKRGEFTLVDYISSIDKSKIESSQVASINGIKLVSAKGHQPGRIVTSVFSSSGMNTETYDTSKVEINSNTHSGRRQGYTIKTDSPASIFITAYNSEIIELYTNDTDIVDVLCVIEPFCDMKFSIKINKDINIIKEIVCKLPNPYTITIQSKDGTAMKTTVLNHFFNG